MTKAEVVLWVQLAFGRTTSPASGRG